MIHPITEHFSREEFDCKDGTPYPDQWVPDRLFPLCKALEVIRGASGGVITVISGYRTLEHNAQVGGATKSQHMIGLAADIMSRKLTPEKLGTLIEALIARGDIPDGGLGIYHSWVHYDHRGTHARWRG